MIPKSIIIHHTATSRDRTTFASVNNYHRKKWNWKSKLGYYIGYQYFITADGVVKQGRADNEDGAHAKGWNDKSIGICLTGNFMLEKPTSIQLKSLEKLLDRLRKKWKIDIKNVFGHREKGVTLCPGTYLMAWIKKYREQKPKPVPTKEDKKSQALDEIVKIIKKYGIGNF